MRKILALSAALATLALAACGGRQEMVAADAPPELPAGALDAIKPETRPAAFGIPDAKMPRDVLPPSKL